mgnify:FL=1
MPRCNKKTCSGYRCTRKVTDNNHRCWQHGGVPPRKRPDNLHMESTQLKNAMEEERVKFEIEDKVLFSIFNQLSDVCEHLAYFIQKSKSNKFSNYYEWSIDVDNSMNKKIIPVIKNLENFQKNKERIYD